jgi:hypothetical protein
MVFDSVDSLCAVALFVAGAAAWWMTGAMPARVRLYLRFAAVLLAAVAASVPLGLSDQTALFLLPLASGSLMIGALARFAAPLPVFVTSMALVASLAGGLGAMLWNLPMVALIPVIVAGLAIFAVALQAMSAIACLAAIALLGSGLTLLEQSVGSGFLLFAAAALVGLAKPALKKSALAVQQ